MLAVRIAMAPAKIETHNPSLLPVDKGIAQFL